jgi:hypothetical protein
VKISRRISSTLALATVLAANLFARAADDPLAWPPITSQTRPWAYNWWMGSAVDKTNITKELQRYHDGGLGGIHIIPIYGARGFEDKYINYLSPQWMEMMSWTVTEAKRLGMGVDMTTGTGWCFGGPDVSDEDANASVIVRTFDVAAGGKLAEKFDRKTTQTLMAFPAKGQPVELTQKISDDGSVDWTAPEGSWTIYAISQKPSGQKVKRPAPGGEGWMLNLFYADAMTNYLKWFGAPFQNYSGAVPRAQYHDSYEYRSDWSPDFFVQFEKRRGYKLQNELPALFSKNPDEHAARVLCDYRQTVSEIMAEETLPMWVKWSHDHGFITREEAHGSPGNWLDLYATADIPETEFFFKSRNILVSKFASSAAHVKGGNLASSESCTWISEHFTETLGEVKELMDELFLSGINHVFYHGCCYSPDEAAWPGWHFYASLEMNPRNSIWHDAPAINNYIARVQSVLQSGKSDNDVLLYWPIEDFWMQPGDQMLPQLRVEAQGWFTAQPIGKTAKELWDKGYAFDYVSDSQLKTAKIVDGKIRMPGGDYKVIVVPECKYIPLQTFKQLVSLAQNGVTIVFEKELPRDVSGANVSEAQRADFLKMQKRLLQRDEKAGLEGLSVTRLGTGIALTGGLDESLFYARVHPQDMVDSGLYFVRRSFPGGWNYFIVNRGTNNVDQWVSLSRLAKSAVILDPMTGISGVAQIKQCGETFVCAHLQLAVGESVILRVFADKKVDGPAWNYFQASSTPTEISGNWNVKFISGGPTLPGEVLTAKLASWTMFGDTNCQAFAGTAKYEITFDAPKSNAKNYFLGLGDVRQSAHVELNGEDYSTLIMSPFRVVVDNLKPTGNVLEVEVTSVTANRIRDLDRRGVQWKTFRDINFVNVNYRPFDASGWPLADCGLLGPVTLTPAAAR